MINVPREEVVRQLVATGKWSETAARLGKRAGYRCEYCALDLLATPEAYKQWQHDHIVPRSHGGDELDFDNLAVSCKSCNWDFKKAWDPRDVTAPNASRDVLVAAVVKYIQEMKLQVK
jgi:5-methylcytosine-specific restriction endonuclease McrA